MVTAGPGNRIAGLDISYWQHNGSAPIDFQKMYQAGVRFVMIKGGDTDPVSDAKSLKYAASDRLAAQRASLYTGIYYYAYLPDTESPALVVRDATTQAQKAIWRLASFGGYNFRDLPMTLDLEENCTRVNANGACTHYMSAINTTLWAKTWLNLVATKTIKKPFLYSYATFITSSMVIDSALKQYPLWLAHYALDPAVASPNQNATGCYTHSWTNSDCTAAWSIWQYSSCGIAKKYGVAGTRVDLNVFNGTILDFFRVKRGQWSPSPSDQLPSNEATTMNLVSQSAKTAADPVTLTVDVLRPDLTGVISGSVHFDSANSLLTPKKQVVSKALSGRFTITMTGLTAGTYVGAINFTDPNGIHAASQIPAVFTVAPAISAPTPTASSTASSTATPAPSTSATKTKSPAPQPTSTYDYCANQIKN